MYTCSFVRSSWTAENSNTICVLMVRRRMKPYIFSILLSLKSTSYITASTSRRGIALMWTWERTTAIRMKKPRHSTTERIHTICHSNRPSVGGLRCVHRRLTIITSNKTVAIAFEYRTGAFKYVLLHIILHFVVVHSSTFIHDCAQCAVNGVWYQNNIDKKSHGKCHKR